MKIKILKIFFIAILMFFANTIISNAGIISVSSSTNGDKATVSVSSSVRLGAYTVRISGMTPISSSGGQSSDDNLVVTNANAEGVTSLATFTFNAPSVDTRVTVSVTGMEDTEFNAQADETVSVTVKAKETTNNDGNTGGSSDPGNSNTGNNNTDNEKSSNANLSNLGIKPNDFTGFKPNKNSYNVTVPNDVTSVEVYAYKGDEGQSVSGTGVKNLKEGENTFEVKVVSEDKSKTNTYTIVVTREKANNEEDNNVVEDANVVDDTQIIEDNVEGEVSGLTLKSLKIVGITDKNGITIEPNISPEFSSDIYEYTTTVQFDVNSLKIEAEPNSENTTIEILGSENFQIGENIVTILLKDNDTGEQQTYQIIVNKTSDVIILENNIKYIKWGIIIAIVVIILIAIIIAVVNHRRKTKIRDSEFGSNNIFDDEYDVPNNVLDVSKNDIDIHEDNYGLGTYDDYNNNDDSNRNRKRGKRFK